MPRKKSVRVRTKLHIPPKSPTTPFLKPISVVKTVDCCLDTMVNEPTQSNTPDQVLETSSGIGKDGNSDDFAPNTSGNVVVPDMSFCVLPPQMVPTKEDFIMMDLTEDEVCLKCGQGGMLLICSGSTCSIAFHENCISLPHFDGAGNFCCPYCLYGQAKAEVRAARERVLLAKKALLIYMEKENHLNSNKRKNGISKGKEHSLSTGEESSGSGGSSHRMKSNNTGNQARQPEKTPKGVSVVCTTNRSPSKEIDMPVLEKKDDGFRNHAAESQSGQSAEIPNGVDVVCATNTLPSLGIDTDGCRDSATQNQSDHQVVLVEDHTDLKLTVACGDGVRSSKKRKSSEFVSVEVDNTVNVEFHEEANELQRDGAIKDQQQAGNSRVSPMEGEMTLTSELNLSGKEQGKNAEPREVNGTKRIKTELMKEHVQDTTLALTVLEPPFQVHEELDTGLETTGSIVEDNETVAILRRHMRDVYKQHSAQPQTVNLPRRLLPLDIVTSKTSGDKSFRINSRQIEGPSKPSMSLPCLGSRRIMWTEEEEEMLKAGVERFSQTINKNLPWKKILEFGHGVFAFSRSPSDLKDKWRNILAKEHSSK